MKKTNYINKYDFINYFSRPKYFLFLSNAEIISIIETATKSYCEPLNSFEEDDIEEYDENQIEYDSYEIYCQAKENNEKIDENNPKIFEGKVLDDKSKDFIKNKFHNINKWIDFDDKEYRKIKQEDVSIQTMNAIINNKEIILFQPVFIDDYKITKPDAIVKNGDEIFVIETKGTSSTKIVHFLDLLFQKKTIEAQEYLANFEFHYKLCVIEYCKLNKNEVNFFITDYFNYKKNLSIPKKRNLSGLDLLELKRNLKLGIDIDSDNYDDYSLKIDCALDGDFSILINKKENKINRKIKDSIDNAIFNMEIPINKFNEIISELKSELNKFHKNWNEKSDKDNIEIIIKKIWPSLTDKNPYKLSEWFILLKPIYSAQGFKTFDYSGNITQQDYNGIKKLIDLTIENNNDRITIEPIFKTSKDNSKRIANLFDKNSKEIQINKEKVIAFMNKINLIKVYFDFETINTAIRSIDNSFPFTQVVTQCSILKMKGTKELSKCDNLICDPKHIDIEWYKKIIDSLYTSDNLIDKTSYIVYNKSFEDSRLKEIYEYLDNNYRNKITKIRNNIIDLADLFKISSKNGFLIFIKKLYGFYSIKKVLPLIEKNEPKLFNISKCENYNNLDISNGKVCQEKTTLRFFNAITDLEWAEVSLNLQKYCENDVRAMLAIELYVRSICMNI